MILNWFKSKPLLYVVELEFCTIWNVTNDTLYYAKKYNPNAKIRLMTKEEIKKHK